MAPGKFKHCNTGLGLTSLETKCYLQALPEGVRVGKGTKEVMKDEPYSFKIKSRFPSTYTNIYLSFYI